MNEPHDMLATAFETEGSGCEHDETTCSDCLAGIAIRTVRRYLLDELDDGDRYEAWYRQNVERLDEIDEDMPHSEAVGLFISEVVLPLRDQQGGDTRA